MKTSFDKMLAATLPLFEIGLGGVLLYSGVTHLQNPFAFLDAVGGYMLLPSWALVPVTILLLASHLVIGIALICQLLRPGVYWVTSGLFTLFLVAQLAALYRGLDVSCGCFGGQGESIGWLTIARTTAMLLVSLLSLHVAGRANHLAEASQPDLGSSVDELTSDQGKVLA